MSIERITLLRQGKGVVVLVITEVVVVVIIVVVVWLLFVGANL